MKAYNVVKQIDLYSTKDMFSATICFRYIDEMGEKRTIYKDIGSYPTATEALSKARACELIDILKDERI